MYNILNLDTMPKVYIALGWPEYQDYMAEDWFLKETYYDVDKDVRLIPKERYDAGIQNNSDN